jgi:hypothetical protein
LCVARGLGSKHDVVGSKENLLLSLPHILALEVQEGLFEPLGMPHFVE